MKSWKSFWLVMALVTGTMGLIPQQQSTRQSVRRVARQAAEFRQSLQPDITFLDARGQPQQGARCATRTPSALELDLSDVRMRAWLREHDVAHRAKKVTIPVYFHVVYQKKGGENVGRIPLPDVELQIAILNDAFKKRGIKFVLKDVDYTKSKKWFRGCSKRKFERQMKRALRVDPMNNLNIYSCKPTSALGWAYLPEGSAGAWWDGVVALHSSLPGGSASPYDEGDTVVHEVGHWAGLLHTFDPEPNGCNEPGDLVDDTPAEKTPDYFCTEGRDTCLQDGLDPIHNFMDYSDDACLTTFTKDQATRMKDQLAAFRGNL